MKNKVIISLFGAMIINSGLNAFDYDFYGGAYTFSKVGFNNVKENKETGKYPTDSFASIALEANVKGSFVEGFTYGLGGMLSAPVWDPYQASYAYINGTARNSLGNNSNEEIGYRYYVLSTVYLGYQYKNNGVDFGIKAGRYDDHGLDWFSGSSEGVHIWIGSDNVKFQANFVNRRGLAANQWFNDFYSVGKKDKNDYNRYFAIASLDMRFGGFGLKPQVWYHRNDYIAPGIDLFYDYKGDSFSAKTSIYSLFVLSHLKEGNIYRNGTDNKLSTILIAQEDMSYDAWNFGAGIWKNWGNPDGNSGIGRHGNKAKIDAWTASAGTSTFMGYDAWALTDVNSENAFTGWLYFGQGLGDFKWELLGRVTTSKSSDEQSLALNLGYQVTEQINLGLKLEYFNDISKPYERAGLADWANQNLGNISNDRSHAFLIAEYRF